MTTTTNTNTLRAAIEAALRRRDRRGMAALLACDDDDVDESIRATTARINDDALRALALACGLRVETCGACNGRGRHDYAREVEDGCDACECAGVVVVDPAAEVERLTQEVATLTRERDEARASVNELASQQQRLMAMIGAQTAEKVRLLTDLAEARSALRDLAARCDASSCDDIATQREHTAFGARACDAHIREFTSIPVDMMHAAALRAAGGGR